MTRPMVLLRAYKRGHFRCRRERAALGFSFFLISIIISIFVIFFHWSFRKLDKEWIVERKVNYALPGYCISLSIATFFLLCDNLSPTFWKMGWPRKKVKLNNKRPQQLLPIAICPSTANWQALILSSRRQFLFLKIMFCLQTRPDKLVANICFFPNGISTNTGIACSIDFRFFFQNKTDHNLSPDFLKFTWFFSFFYFE